jgi:hypothetical protein
LGTDADPVRKLLLLKAMRELPDTHPYAILGAHCRAGTRTPAEADACRERLSRRVELSLHHESVALNSTATFRAPAEGREKLYSQPFVFNVECAALLCAYTRILAAHRPYALLHRDFKVEVGHASPFNSRHALEALFSVLARRFAGRAQTLRVVEFASGNMYGAVPALAALADLGFVKIEYHLVDKEYDAWLKTASLHPAPESGLPHAIDFAAVWKAWEQQVNDAARPHASKVSPHEFVDAEQEPVRDLVLLTLERGQQRLADAAAQLHEYERLAAIAAKAVEQAREAKAKAKAEATGGAEGGA